MRSQRHRRREPAAHLDDWLMTYADMITLLLCLFVTFVVVSSTHKDVLHRAPAQAVTAQIPPALPAPPVLAAMPQATDQPPAAPAAVARAAPPVPELASDTDRRSAATAEAATPLDHPAAPAPSVKIVDANSQSLAVVPPPELADAPKPQHPVAAPPPPSVADAPQGDRITTLDMGSEAFFDSGSATLSQSGQAILRGVLPRLAAALTAGYRIKVEGHTDDTPIHTAQFPSNWQLSTARAAAVVEFYLAQGLPAQRLRAVGCADTEPKAPDRDAAGNPIPQNQAANRRVVIVLEKIDRAAR